MTPPSNVPTPAPDPDSQLLRLSHRLADDPGFFSYHLARDRDASGQSITVQAAALNLTLDALGALALCRTPRTIRAAQRESDIARVAAYARVPVPVLERLLVGVPGPGVPLTAQALRHVDAAGVRTLAKIIRERYAGGEARKPTADEMAVLRVAQGLRQADMGDVGSGVWVGDRPGAEVVEEVRRSEAAEDDEREKRRVRARERFVMTSAEGVTIDGLSVAAWMASRAVPASQDD
jgi:hypothetical protein